MKTIYYFGNPLIRVDKKPIELIPHLVKKYKKLKFIHADPTETFELTDKTLFIIDTVVGIQHVTLFESLTEFVKSPRYSVHDYDVLSDAALLVKLGKIKKIYIVGIPPQGIVSELASQAAEILLKTILL
jgi:hypothetical protein